MFSLICARIKDWVNSGDADDLRRYRAHYDVTVMYCHISQRPVNELADIVGQTEVKSDGMDNANVSVSCVLLFKTAYHHSTACAFQIRHMMNRKSTSGFPHKQPGSNAGFDAVFDISLNKRLNKQSSCRWFETAWRSFWYQCNVTSNTFLTIKYHYSDVIMCAMASQITSLRIVYSTVYSDTDQIKHQSSASLAFVRGLVLKMLEHIEVEKKNSHHFTDDYFKAVSLY